VPYGVGGKGKKTPIASLRGEGSTKGGGEKTQEKAFALIQPKNRNEKIGGKKKKRETTCRSSCEKREKKRNWFLPSPNKKGRDRRKVQIQE